MIYGYKTNDTVAARFKQALSQRELNTFLFENQVADLMNDAKMHTRDMNALLMATRRGSAGVKTFKNLERLQ